MQNENTPLSTPRRSSAAYSRLRLRRPRRRIATIRLGGKKSRGRLFVVGLYRRAKLKWMKAKFLRMLKKLKNGYDLLVKDLVVENNRGSIESYQQRMLLESSITVPVMGFSFFNYTGNMTR